MSQMIEQ